MSLLALLRSTTATPKASILTDNFDDNSLDASKWGTGSFYPDGSALGTINETNARLEVTPQANVSAGDNFLGVISAEYYDFVGERVCVRIVVPAGSHLQQHFLGVGIDRTHQVAAFVQQDDTLHLYVASGGAFFSTGSTVAFTSGWLSLRHGGAGDDTIYLEYSASTSDAVPTSWTAVTSVANPLASLTRCKIVLQSGTFASDSAPKTVAFDGLSTTANLYGPEIVLDGGFPNATNWNVPSGGSITGGQFVGAAANGYLFQNSASILAGHTYQITYTVSGITAGSTYFAYLGASVTQGVVRTVTDGNGTFTEIITPTSNSELGIHFNNFTGNIDDLSIREFVAKTPLYTGAKSKSLVYKGNKAETAIYLGTAHSSIF